VPGDAGHVWIGIEDRFGDGGNKKPGDSTFSPTRNRESKSVSGWKVGFGGDLPALEMVGGGRGGECKLWG